MAPPVSATHDGRPIRLHTVSLTAPRGAITIKTAKLAVSESAVTSPQTTLLIAYQRSFKDGITQQISRLHDLPIALASEVPDACLS